MEIPKSSFTVETFTPHIGEEFIVSIENQKFSLKLILAEASVLHPRDGRSLGKSGFVRTDPFSLLFECNQSLPQMLYEMNHAVMGEFQIGLVPVGPTNNGWGMEAVFN